MWEGDPEDLDTYTYKLLAYFDALLSPGTYNYACTKHEGSSPINISQSPCSTSTEVVVYESERYPSIIPYRVLPKPELLKRIETFTELEKQFYTSPIERDIKLYRSKKYRNKNMRKNKPGFERLSTRGRENSLRLIMSLWPN